MPVHAVHEVLSERPPEPESPFELAARRMIDRWLATGSVTATADDLRLAARFLAGFGLTVEALPGREVRIGSERDGAAVVTREEAVLTAIRRLATRAGRAVARAA